jgi:hypothetical protein
MKSLLIAAALFAALPCSAQSSAPPSRGLRIASPAWQARLAGDGSYSLAFPAAQWKLEGQLPSPVTDLRSTSGVDRIGAYRELSAEWNGGGRRAEIRVYRSHPLILLNDVWLRAGANQQPFPTFQSLPADALRISYRDDNFGIYQFGKLNSLGPWTLFDREGRALTISPANHFLISTMNENPGGSASSGINAAIAELPAGFSHGTLLAAGTGIHQVDAAWGDALLALGGKHRPSNDADATLAKIGYWTDNRTVYYYKFDPKLGYEGTLLAVRDEFRRLKIPLGYLQLDSWFYPKSSADRWDSGGGTLPYGEYVYRADKELFPQGLAAFERALGLPLVTHARWVAPSSPYHQQYSMSGNVVVDPRFWRSTARYLHHAGVITYEQDWLNENAQTAMNLRDPSLFLRQMAQAMSAEGLSIQYCMPLPSDYMASTLYPAVQTIRTSDDGFERGQWDSFLYDSQLASAVGLWPWTDAFFSKDLGSLMISTLSGGPVGIGDALGDTDVANVMAAIRADGVLIKPDQPLLPIDTMYVEDAQSDQKPMVAAARTAFASTGAVYLFAYPRRASDTGVTVPLSALGLSQPAYAWNWVSHSGELIPAGGSVSMSFANGWAYDVLVPVAQDGLALLGDAAKITTLGRQRIAALSNRGEIIATVEFAPGEHDVELSGYAAETPIVSAKSGSAHLVRYDTQSHAFAMRVSPGPAHQATIQIRLKPRGAA